MRLTKESRCQGLVDADYCLQLAHDMLDVFNKSEIENEGFNTMEMLMIKALFDDVFDNVVKSSYTARRKEVSNILSNLEETSLSQSDNVIDLFETLNKKQ